MPKKLGGIGDRLRLSAERPQIEERALAKLGPGR
jgi:hypothetical protein